MKKIAPTFFLLLYTVSTSIIDYRNTDLRTVIIDVNFSKTNVLESEVQFRIFSIKGKSKTTGIYNKNNIWTFDLNQHLPTRFLIHGWLSSEVASFWYRNLKREYSKKDLYNLVYVDWSVPASRDYNISSANAKRVGRYLTDFIIAANLKPHLVHLIGFSLGAHVAGFAGKHYHKLTGVKLSRITSLDASAPFFKDMGPENRVAVTDAMFVDAVITDANHYGMPPGFGHVHFIANRGHMQPGCPSLKEDDNCSHQRAPIYYAESVNKYQTAVSADSWDTTSRKQVVFGETTSHLNRGYFILNTRSEAPFLIDDAQEMCSIQQFLINYFNK